VSVKLVNAYGYSSTIGTATVTTNGTAPSNSADDGRDGCRPGAVDVSWGGQPTKSVSVYQDALGHSRR